MGRIASALFADLSSSELDGILGRMKARCYAPGQYICREGDTSDRMYLIESGVVEVIIGEGPSSRVLIEIQIIRCVTGHEKGCRFEKPSLRRSEQGSNCPVQRVRYGPDSVEKLRGCGKVI
jgi:CRP-like cAMP-binding protein